MKRLEVDTVTNLYPIYIENDFSGLGTAFTAAGLTGCRVVIVTDSNVARLYLQQVMESLSEVCTSVSHTVFPAGEENKNLDTVRDFYQFFVEKELDRSSVVVALGGGVTGDMAGFAAATYLRGISYVQAPTTLLSQVDSSVGGKVGVDFAGNKNFVGAFYQPRLVYMNISTLSTLDASEISAGMGEVVKHGFIKSEPYYRFVADNIDKIKALEPDVIAEMVYGSCKIKAEVVSLDEKESGLREILNFGHTFGHAVESMSDFSILHGHCVGHGMRAALYLSNKKGYISTNELRKAVGLLDNFGMPSGLPGYNPEQLLKQMRYDKKTRNGKLRLVLLDKMGSAYTNDEISDGDILEACGYMVAPCPVRNGE